MKFRRLLVADIEMFEAARWYDNRRDQFGDAFLDEIENAFNRIVYDPLQFPRVYQLPNSLDLRRCIVRRFPFVIIYRILDDEILVVAVSHARRGPYYWLKRLG